ncbi:MAG: NfeD family protein [Bacteroidales bacterium]|nr:NfeD family protein [Bacteroidales bacterium]
MNTIKRLLFLAIAMVSILSISAKNPLIYKINFKDEVGPKTWIFICKGFKEAHAKKADIILIEMNTYGGTVLHADSIRTLILNYPKPVYVFINNNAASAGALISIACDSIYMKPGANIGAATVVNETGQAMPDKYQSYMRSIIRSTAEAQGKDTIIDNGTKIAKWRRDPHIAEAMVDPSVVIKGVIDSGKVLTFTAQEAIKYGFCDGIVDNADELITKRLGYKTYNIETFEPSIADTLKGILSNPALQAILIMIILGGIYFELQTPGIGFPLAASATAAILYFAPLYIDGLAQNWEILLFIVGCILLLFEVFVIPGFGIAGISGISLIFVGLFLSLLDNVNFSFDKTTSHDSSRAILTLLSGITLGVVAIIWLANKIGSNGLFNRLALHKAEDKADGYVSVSMELGNLLGKTGRCETILRPSGKVRIDGIVYDAISINSYIDKDEEIMVVKFENAQIYVKQIL